MLIFGQQVDNELLWFDEDENVDDEYYINIFSGLDDFEPIVCDQVVGYRYINAYKFHVINGKLHEHIKPTIKALTKRAMRNGESLEMIVRNLNYVLYNMLGEMPEPKSTPKLTKALAEYESPSHFGELLCDAKFGKHLTYCVKCYCRLSQPMVKSARKV